MKTQEMWTDAWGNLRAIAVDEADVENLYRELRAAGFRPAAEPAPASDSALAPRITVVHQAPRITVVRQAPFGDFGGDFVVTHRDSPEDG